MVPEEGIDGLFSNKCRTHSMVAVACQYGMSFAVVFFKGFLITQKGGVGGGGLK